MSAENHKNAPALKRVQIGMKDGMGCAFLYKIIIIFHAILRVIKSICDYITEKPDCKYEIK
jgi:hypothetical protein